MFSLLRKRKEREEGNPIPELQQFIVSIRDDWPNIKLMVTVGTQLVTTDTKQYDVAQLNFEVKLRNVLQQAIERVTRAHLT